MKIQVSFGTKSKSTYTYEAIDNSVQIGDIVEVWVFQSWPYRHNAMKHAEVVAINGNPTYNGPIRRIVRVISHG